jgi:hypothetical protein
MSRVIYLCSRRPLSPGVEETIQGICQRLQPDNILPRDARIEVEDDVAYGVMNPTAMLLTKRRSLLVGQIFGDPSDWDVPLAAFPDGSYALFRDDLRHCEVVADPAASRTIWYYFDERVFIASLSQRAIVMFLRTFHFDERVIPWMLSSGTMGPSLSWDRRFQRIGADSSVVLDKREWSLSSRSSPQDLRPISLPDAVHKERVKHAVTAAFRSVPWDSSTWVLPLSGGYDSRGILCFLKEAEVSVERVKTITWGSESSPSVAGNDAQIAPELARVFGAPHEYYHNEASEESISALMDRFIRLGEGRIDHLSGYMDGFKMWKALFERGVQGIVRGDQAFGSKLSRSERAVRRQVGWRLLSDIPNMKRWCSKLPPQIIHGGMHRKSGESLQMWSDRLRVTYRMPTNLAALSDLKSGYVDQVNPLLSRGILDRVRELPDHLRANKGLWKEIVADMSPDLPFADEGANVQREDIFRREDMLALLSGTLRSDHVKTLIDPALLEFAGRGLGRSTPAAGRKETSWSLKAYLSRVVPKDVASAIRVNLIGTDMRSDTLAFRILMISSAWQLFTEDSQPH